MALRAEGVDARWVQVAGLLAPAPLCDPRWRSVHPRVRVHYVMVVDGVVHDLAPRQFWPDAPCPLVNADYLDWWERHYDVTDALVAV